MSDLAAFQPDHPGTTAAFADSSALFALFRPRDECHDSIRTFLDGIHDESLPYRRLYVNDYVLDEVATRLRYRATHDRAVTALGTVAESEIFRTEYVDKSLYEAGRTIFVDYGDQELSLTDAVIVAHCRALDLEHIVTYDGDFEAFDRTVIPYY